MKKHKSNICYYYERRINNEIAAGEFVADHALVGALENGLVTSAGKAAMGLPETLRVTMLDLVKKAVDVLPRMRFIYLLSLLEAFFKDYLCERGGINIDQIKDHVRDEKSTWSRVSNNESTSFCHIPYALFIINEKYGTNVSSQMNKAILEAGVLRNCIVHHNGKVVDRYFVSGLKEIAAFQGNTLSVNDFVVIDKRLMELFIKEARKIITLLDYQ